MAQAVKARTTQATPADPTPEKLQEPHAATDRAAGESADVVDTGAAGDEHASVVEELANDDSGVWMAFVKGAAIGFFVVGAVVATISLALGLGWTVALSLAAFTGVWGGPGFGGMMGAVLHHTRTH